MGTYNNRNNENLGKHALFFRPSIIKNGKRMDTQSKVEYIIRLDYVKSMVLPPKQYVFAYKTTLLCISDATILYWTHEVIFKTRLQYSC